MKQSVLDKIVYIYVTVEELFLLSNFDRKLPETMGNDQINVQLAKEHLAGLSQPS